MDSGLSSVQASTGNLSRWRAGMPARQHHRQCLIEKLGYLGRSGALGSHGEYRLPSAGRQDKTSAMVYGYINQVAKLCN